MLGIVFLSLRLRKLKRKDIKAVIEGHVASNGEKKTEKSRLFGSKSYTLSTTLIPMFLTYQSETLYSTI